MIDLLDDDELQAVIGHEIAHLSPRVRWLNRALLVLRWLPFYNPLPGLVFRRIINDIEMLCDDTAVRLTGKRLPLTSGLLKISRTAAKTRPAGPDEGPTKPARTRLEDIANHNLVRERARRLVQGAGEDIPYQGLRLSVTALGLAALLFFVV